MSMNENSPSQVVPFPADRSGKPAAYEQDAAPSVSAMEFDDMRQLQAISTRLIQEDAESLHDAILDAALNLLRSDMATMQLFDPARNGLTMLSSRGFDPEHIKLFHWVGRDAGSSCAAAMRAASRVTIPDIELSEHCVGKPEHGALRLCGIRAAQSTPLLSRDGTMIGMITNHWRQPHTPDERALQLIDVLARQAADLIDRRKNEAHIALLAREAEHRAKNMLAAVLAVVRLTKADTAQEMKDVITGRIGALDNVHRLFVETNWAGADLRVLITGELTPYLKREDLAADIGGPGVQLGTNAAQAVSMTLHELATNAAKYGALSASGGQVRVHWTRDDAKVTIRWAETGGPAITKPRKRGVGTKVMESMINGQTGGTIRHDWRAEGLFCEFSLPIS